MKRKNFKEILASSGPDTPKTPPQSRAQRLANVARPIVAEVLEPRCFLTVTAQIDMGVLVVTSNGDADTFEVYSLGDGIIYVDEESSNVDSFDSTGRHGEPDQGSGQRRR